MSWTFLQTGSGDSGGNLSPTGIVVPTSSLNGGSSFSLGGSGSGASGPSTNKYSVGVRSKTDSATYVGKVSTARPVNRGGSPPSPFRTLSTSFVSEGVQLINSFTGVSAAESAGGVAYKDVLGLSVGSKVYWLVRRSAHQVHIGVAGPSTAHDQPPGESDNPGIALVTSAAPYVTVGNATTPVGSAVPTTVQIAVEILTTTSLRVWWYTLEGGLLAGPVDWTCGETWAPFIYLAEVGASAWLDDGRNSNSFRYL